MSVVLNLVDCRCVQTYQYSNWLIKDPITKGQLKPIDIGLCIIAYNYRVNKNKQSLSEPLITSFNNSICKFLLCCQV